MTSLLGNSDETTTLEQFFQDAGAGTSLLNSGGKFAATLQNKIQTEVTNAVNKTLQNINRDPKTQSNVSNNAPKVQKGGRKRKRRRKYRKRRYKRSYKKQFGGFLGY